MAEETRKKRKYVRRREPEPKKPSLGELASAADDIYLAWTPRYYNPDRLAAKKGGLRIYKTMREDDQVKACLRLKKAATTTSGWDIEVPVKDNEISEKAEEQKEFIQYVFGQMEGTVEGMITSILSAFDYGFSVHEKVYNYIDQGKFRGKIGIKAVRAKSPTRLNFEIDRTGKLKPMGLTQRQDDGKYTPLPIDKFVIYTYQKEFDNYYGESDLKSAYRPWFVKHNVMRYWAIYLEKFSIPIAKGQVTAGRVTETQREDFKSLMQRIQSGMSVLLPQGMTLDLLESDRIDRGVFNQAVEALNIAIARSILIPQMIGLVPAAGTGSYAKGDIELKMFDWILKDINTNTQEVINEQLVRPLIDVNYGEQEEYPRFVIKPLKEEDKQKIVAAWSEAVARGAVTVTVQTEKYLRDLLKFPEMEQDEEALAEEASHLNIDRFPPVQGAQAGGGGGGGGNGKAKGTSGIKNNPSGGKGKMANAPGSANQYGREYAQRVITGPEARADFEGMEEDLNRIEGETVSDLTKEFENSIYKMIEDAKKKSRIQSGSSSRTQDGLNE